MAETATNADVRRIHEELAKLHASRLSRESQPRP
jgi:hypothetical protein